MKKAQQFLGPRETFELYEKRAHSPLNNARPPSVTLPSPIIPVQRMEQSYPQGRAMEYVPEPGSYAFVPVEQDKRKVPLAWIIGLSIVVPVFVILMLFLAVWLQEMGII